MHKSALRLTGQVGAPDPLEQLRIFRMLIDLSNDAIYILDPDSGRILDCNEKAYLNLGYTRDELLGMTVREVDASLPSGELWNEQSRAIREQGEVIFESRHLRKDGTSFPVEINARSIVQNDYRFFVGIVRDITDRKRKEREQLDLISKLHGMVDTITHSQQEWQNTFDAISDPIFITDAEQTLIRVNSAFLEFTGLSFEKILGKKCCEVIHNDNTFASFCPREKMTLAHKPADVELFDQKRGSVLIITHFPSITHDGVFVGSINIVRDVTRERERDMKMIMNERLASLGQMASSIAHEINNPLSAILGCAAGLKNRIRTNRYEPDHFLRYLDIVEEEVERCRKITGSMRLLSKRSSPSMPLDIHALIERSIEFLRSQGRWEQIEIRRHFAEAPPELYGAEHEIQQVFTTLLSNALDAMQYSGVITITTSVRDDRFTVSIEDTGPGIDPADQPRIFEPFFTTKASQGATGLGLAIAHKIAINHKGSLLASSDPGKGATFSLILPIPVITA